MAEAPVTPERSGAARLAATLLARIESVLGTLGGILLAALFLLVLGSILLRHLASSGIDGAEELATWLFIALVFIGFPVMSTSPLAMRLDFLIVRLRATPRAVVVTLADGIGLFAALVVLSGGIDVTAAIGGISPSLGLPEGLRFAPVALAGGLAVLTLFLNLLASGRRIADLAAVAAIGGALFAVSHLPGLMPMTMPSLAASAIAMLALMIGVPLPHALIAGLALAVCFGARMPEAAIVQNVAAGTGKFLLLAIPFFLLAGILMHAGHLASRLVALASALVGHKKGGLAQTTLLTNLLFSGVSGSSVADAAFSAKVLTPGLTASGYRPEQAAAICAATSILPNILPPSIAFLMLAVVTNLSVGALFTGGLVAGLFLAAALAVAIHFMADGKNGLPPASREERLRTAKRALPVLGLAAVIFFGIRLGFATPTEAAALAVLYTLLALPRDERASRPRVIRDAFKRAASESSAIGMLIGASAPFVFILALDRLPQAVEHLMMVMGGGPWMVMLTASILLLIAGLALDIAPGILLFSPLLMPSAVAAGIDPIHFGVLIVINLMIGGLTPPVGLLVFVAAAAAGQTSEAVFKAVLPLTLALTAALGVLSVFAVLWAIF
ncbi:MAG: TRAP transporter large permease subunit [Rhodospirillaceae bacterium]|nr:TRAP transporter large permease subunit [Rhodospirillaceae bacterium]